MRPRNLRLKMARDQDPDERFPIAAEGSPEQARLRSRLSELLHDTPYVEITIKDFLAASGVSEREFYRHYGSLDTCFTELCRSLMQEAARQTFAAYAAETNWRDGIRAQIWSSYEFLVTDQTRSRICVVDVNFAGDDLLAIRDLFMNAFIELVHLGRHERATAVETPRARAEAVAGATWELIAAPVRGGRFELLIEVVPQILYMLYLPYLGETEARTELKRARDEVDRRRSNRASLP